MARKLAIHLAANAVVLALGYYWLGIAESRAGTLAWSGVVALIAAVIGVWVIRRVSGIAMKLRR